MTDDVSLRLADKLSRDAPLTAEEEARLLSTFNGDHEAVATYKRAVNPRLRAQARADYEQRLTAAHDRLAAAEAASRQWEANPAGLSGRVVRGYRHWRYKR